jgi:hypothetical protein
MDLRLVAGLHVGAETAPEHLVHLLRADDLSNWDTFQDQLSGFRDCTARLKVSGGKRTLWSQVFGDLADAAAYYPREAIPSMRRTIRPTAEAILSTLKRFSALDPVPALEGRPSDWSRLLAQDLLTGSTNYLNMIQDDTIPLVLRNAGYKLDVVRECLDSHPDATSEALLRATETDEISIDQEPGRGDLALVVDFLEQYGLTESLQDVEERLYEMCAPWHRRVALDICADLVGGVYAASTFGIALANPVIGDIRRSAYHRYVAGRLRAQR